MEPLNHIERRAVSALALIFGLRMFGLFLVLPVLALYADGLPGATPLVVGLALGVYGLTQAIFQIPFGRLSDRFGRKGLITFGLLLFALGSVVSAEAATVPGIIAGRALQGAGAIAAVVLALLADLTREQQRIKATALVGGMIGVAFLTALMGGSVLEGLIGVPGLFYLAAFAALVVMPVLWWGVPTPLHSGNLVYSRRRGDWSSVFSSRHLLRLDFGVFVQHLSLMALFVAVPPALVDVLGLGSPDHWRVYVPVLVTSVVAMLPLLLLSMRSGKSYTAFRAALSLMLVSAALLAWAAGQGWGLVGGLVIFFTGFNLLEALLPSLVSRVAPSPLKGTALGVYNTCQFAGVFVGGAVGGVIFGHFGPAGVFLLMGTLLALWWIVVLLGDVPELMNSVTVYLEDMPAAQFEDRIAALRQLPGVYDVTVLAGQNMVYLKVSPSSFHNASLADVAGVSVH
ncbi:MAG TPA: MFS transporter [Gammaproteobacteria bacterium]|nr:MFS transporter [Gammaproteobacteria bacterium]